MANILILDDNHDMVLALSEVLNLHGHTVITGHSGDDGVNILNSGDTLPDAILSDVDMPFMTGFELMEYLQQHNHLSHIPVAIMSGRRDDEKPARRGGAKAFILKPFKFNDLNGIIESLLS